MDKVKVFLLLAIFLLCGCLFIAADKVFSANSYSVTANVPSPVSAEKTEIKTNTISTLADPVNHPIVIFVQLKDKAGQLLAGRTVTAESDRGSVDIIEAASKISGFTVQAAENSDLNADVSDDDGRVAFRITSFVPGDVNISLTADSVVKLSPVKIGFKPLPMPWYATIRFQYPFTDKTYVIFSNQIEMNKLSPAQRNSAIGNDIGTLITLSLWEVLLFSVIVLFPSFIGIVDFISLMRIWKKEKERDEKIYLGDRCQTLKA